MKKIVFLTGLLSFAWLSLFSQNNFEDVLYLKNGSILRGTVLEWVPDSIVKIEIAGGSLLVYKASEVRMISKEEKLKKEKQRAAICEVRGFQFGVEAGWIIGSGDNQNKTPLSIHLQSFYHVLPSTAVGVGAGLEFFNTTQAPVYMDFRQYFNRKYDAPYIFVQSGFLFPVGPNHEDVSGYESRGKTGYMFNPGIGFIFPLSEKSELTISISYRYQEVKSTIKDYYKPNYERIEKMNRLNFKVGFLLH